ncbi:hypothetical protein J6590_042910 [Homalodisca vitripennis]|nr:hypothetical protein J6590_042910 [Homalodisca vitripennis]
MDKDAISRHGRFLDILTEEREDFRDNAELRKCPVYERAVTWRNKTIDYIV